jgi:hypothetical protein
MEEMITIPKFGVRRTKKTVSGVAGKDSLIEGRDRKTSSTPLFQDIERSNQHSLCTPNGKKSGGQIGHRGHHLSMVNTAGFSLENEGDDNRF